MMTKKNPHPPHNPAKKPELISLKTKLILARTVLKAVSLYDAFLSRDLTKTYKKPHQNDLHLQFFIFNGKIKANLLKVAFS